VTAPMRVAFDDDERKLDAWILLSRKVTKPTSSLLYNISGFGLPVDWLPRTARTQRKQDWKFFTR